MCHSFHPLQSQVMSIHPRVPGEGSGVKLIFKLAKPQASLVTAVIHAARRHLGTSNGGNESSLRRHQLGHGPREMYRCGGPWDTSSVPVSAVVPSFNHGERHSGFAVAPSNTTPTPAKPATPGTGEGDNV